VVVIDRANKADLSLLEDLIEFYFTSPNFKDNADFCKVLGWRNEKVDMFNNHIRFFMFGEGAKRIEIGEKLVANKPICWGDDILFTNNEEFEVESFEVLNEEINGGDIILKYYYAMCAATANVVTGAVKKNKIRIIHEDSLKQFEDICQILLTAAKRKRAPSQGHASSNYFHKTIFIIQRFEA